MVLIVADFFWVEPRGWEAICPRKGHRATCSHVWLRQIMYTTHARPGFTDRPEIGQSIATVLIASSEVCACAASESRLILFFPSNLEIPDSNEVPDDFRVSSYHKSPFMEGPLRYQIIRSTANTNRYLWRVYQDFALAGSRCTVRHQPVAIT
jgi:hypothetical protein